MNGVLGMIEVLERQGLDERAAAHRRRPCASRRRRCCASSTTCSTSPRSRPAGSSWRRPPFSLAGLIDGAAEHVPAAGREQGPGARRRRSPPARPTRWSATRRGCGRSCSTCSATRSSSPSAAASTVRAGTAPLGDGAATCHASSVDRHRHRPRRRAAGAPVPAVRAGRQLDHAPLRRHRPRPLDRAPAGRS